MSKIRRHLIGSVGVIAIMALSGCNVQVTDTGSSKMLTVVAEKSKEEKKAEAEIDKNAYLNLNVLSQKADKKTEYKIFEVKRGDFENTYDKDKAEVTFEYGSIPVKAENKSGTMYYVELDESKLWNQVKKGEPLVNVFMDVDMTEVTGLQINLERYKQRLVEDEANYEKQKKELQKSLNQAQNVTDRLEINKQLDNCDSQWNKTKKNWKRTIRDTEKRITEIQESANMTAITAPQDGFYGLMGNYYFQSGMMINKDQNFGYIVPFSPIYVQVDNKNGFYSYGKKVKVKFGSKEFDGTVLTADKRVAHESSASDQAYIEVDCTIADIMNVPSGSISLVTQTMKDILLVDREAVTNEDGSTYVTVLNKDGSLCRTGFVAGGSNSKYYWVYSGLEEGMQLVKAK